MLRPDPHPGDVLLARSGPVMIDRRDAGAGDPAADVATTVVRPVARRSPGPTARLVRSPLVRGVRKGCRTDLVERTGEAAEAGPADPNLTAATSCRRPDRTARPLDEGRTRAAPAARHDTSRGAESVP
ncbi:hypothetical protein ACF07T_16675 [Streptomyces sp. NPDC015184]|uniref:hypothetical protein n=1 Tax=Streptomyces sp. NPDC015184 TaxID=3364946 RepID=UPI0037020DB1